MERRSTSTIAPPWIEDGRNSGALCQARSISSIQSKPIPISTSFGISSVSNADWKSRQLARFTKPSRQAAKPRRLSLPGLESLMTSCSLPLCTLWEKFMLNHLPKQAASVQSAANWGVLPNARSDRHTTYQFRVQKWQHRHQDLRRVNQISPARVASQQNC